MPGDRFDDGLNQFDERVIAEAEADLQRLLSVNASPEFAAKVRLRIDAERSSSSRWFSGWQLGLAAASIVIVGIIVGLVPLRQGPTNVPAPAPAVAIVQPTTSQPTATLVRPIPAPTPDQVVTNSAVSPRSRRAPAGQRATSSEQRAAKEPEVLVPPDQRIAIARALAMSRTGALDERMFAEPLATVVGDDAQAVPPIVVEDVVVPPVTAPGSGIEKAFERD